MKAIGIVNLRRTRHILFLNKLSKPPRRISVGAWVLTLLLAIIPLANAQDSPSSSERKTETCLHPGSNEFGVWTGYSPFSFKFKGVTKDRQLFLLHLQYAQTILASRPLTLKYTAEIVPVALEMQPTQVYFIGEKELVNRAGTIYGAGASPIGFQGNFGRKRVQPLASGSVGFLYFNQQVPVVGSSQFNYTITVGAGAQFFRRRGRSFTVGWKYHHLSNNYQAPLNPGIDSSVFYAGFSIWSRGR